MPAARAIARAAALASTLLAGGCTSLGIGNTEPVRCPHVAIMPDLQAVAKFGPGPSRQDSNVAYGARMLASAVSCELDKKKNVINVTTKLGVVALRNSIDVKTVDVTYLVAVVDRNSQILTERDFVIDLEFPGDQRRLEVTEQHLTLIPLAKGRIGEDYGIVFGFRLTPEELEYNRAHAQHGPS
ncbi:MAG TPA: hypothetical protein VEC75_12935 [Stellaceae bacterium]|nr:hypothetical protein [Stellaceae bacterium]